MKNARQIHRHEPESVYQDGAPDGDADAPPDFSFQDRERGDADNPPLHQDEDMT